MANKNESDAKKQEFFLQIKEPFQILMESRHGNVNNKAKSSKIFWQKVENALDKLTNILSNLKSNYNIIHPINDINDISLNIPNSYPSNNIRNFNCIQLFIWNINILSFNLDPLCL